ncbi:aldehyde dehydrogenase [Aaosphaeria arxii CBS 175.79]|uniref:aldehyde dehydrogenase (NAD(+)) n=1 Tax=Aaosphaeria arxii CBS 175.79 TaxID=1450172 RepID=A0A6A5Y4L7_9PLEO|nr:aldehyde dehydrogenase [Aaosphaeria arxii CBS 175.79]KAF2019977.1 aldehyde dehydrogenase [Aaosphaeria arxii CBS 175.79]
MNVAPDFEAFTNTVNGDQRSALKAQRTIDPSTKRALWPVPIGSTQDIEDAIFAAQHAFTTWSKTTWAARQDVLSLMHAALQAQRENMAKLLTLEGGKPIQFSEMEVDHSLRFLEFNSKQAQIQDVIVQDDDELHLSLRYRPIGLVAAICPWNYPLVLAIAKIGAALITGNCVIVKPSPYTPYSILKFTELVQPLLPRGVLQAIHGDDSLGPYLCAHPRIQKISFTGSTATGKKIMSSSAQSLKRLTLELGGNNASIILPDVDPGVVAPQVALGSFLNSGQLCVASKRIYVHQDIYDEFLRAMVDTVRSWKVGPTSGFVRDLTLGPVQNEMQFNKVMAIIENSRANGHRFALGGDRDEAHPESYVIAPIIVDRPPDNSLVVTSEAFGPIVPVLSWTDDEEVIERVNNDVTGLGGAIWTSDQARAQHFADRIETGTVWINSIEKPLPQAYFAGLKESGLGGEWGEQGLLAYCKVQTIHRYKPAVTI